LFKIILTYYARLSYVAPILLVVTTIMILSAKQITNHNIVALILDIVIVLLKWRPFCRTHFLGGHLKTLYVVIRTKSLL